MPGPCLLVYADAAVVNFLQTLPGHKTALNTPLTVENLVVAAPGSGSAHRDTYGNHLRLKRVL